MSGGADKLIHVWDFNKFNASGEVCLATTYKGHSFGVTDIDVSPLDLYFASASEDRSGKRSKKLLILLIFCYFRFGRCPR